MVFPPLQLNNFIGAGFYNDCALSPQQANFLRAQKHKSLWGAGRAGRRNEATVTQPGLLGPGVHFLPVQRLQG